MKTIQLSRGLVALVDDEDFDLVKEYPWHAKLTRNKSRDAFYVEATVYRKGEKRKHVYLHRLILGFPEGYIDHRDGDGLNNCRSNLRLATNSQNMANRRKTPRLSSKWKGVSWKTREQKWQVSIRIGNNRKQYLGLFVDEDEAGLAYNARALELFGEYARLNECEKL